MEEHFSIAAIVQISRAVMVCLIAYLYLEYQQRTLELTQKQISCKLLRKFENANRIGNLFSSFWTFRPVTHPVFTQMSSVYAFQLRNDLRARLKIGDYQFVLFKVLHVFECRKFSCFRMQQSVTETSHFSNQVLQVIVEDSLDEALLQQNQQLHRRRSTLTLLVMRIFFVLYAKGWKDLQVSF